MLREHRALEPKPTQTPIPRALSPGASGTPGGDGLSIAPRLPDRQPQMGRHIAAGDDPQAALASEAAMIAEALANGSVEEREAAYVTVEGAVKAEAVAYVVACVRPIIQFVLSAPANRVGVAEWRRASLLLFAMEKLDDIAVCTEMHRKDDDGNILFYTMYTTPDTVWAAVLAKEPSAWDRDDALSISYSLAHYVPTFALGTDAVLAEAGVGGMDYMGLFLAVGPWWAVPKPADRFKNLALLAMELIRSEIDEQPEAVIAGAACCCFMLRYI